MSETKKTKYSEVLLNNMKNKYLDGTMKEHPIGVVLGYFLENPDSNINQICKKTKLGKPIIKSTLDYLLKTNILRNGTPNNFKLNTDNKAIQNMLSKYQASKQDLQERFKDYEFKIYWPYEEELNPDCEAVNIHITTKDGSKYVSDFFTTPDFIQQLFEKNKQTGENANGTYDEWYNVIIVKKLTHDNIKKTLDDLIKEEKIEDFFDRIEEI